MRTGPGGPVGIGRYANRRNEVFSAWKASIREIAKCPNVTVKLGGLAMRLLGYDFHERPMPPSSEEAAAAWRPYIETCIEAFGPQRGMFESNFPPDKGQCSYQVIFNAFKRIAAQYSETEQAALFSNRNGFLPAQTGLTSHACVSEIGMLRQWRLAGAHQAFGQPDDFLGQRPR